MNSRMRTIRFVAAVVAATVTTTTAAAASARVGSPCPAPPAKYRPVPFDKPIWDLEVTNWGNSCGIAWAWGPRKFAALTHLAGASKLTLAQRYADTAVRMQLRSAHFGPIIRRLGVTRLHDLIVDGVLTGFRLRGKP